MSTQWQYLQDGQSIGPIDEQDLREMLASGELKPSAPIRCTDLGEASWRPAKSVPEFKALFSVTAVSVTVPSAAVSTSALVESTQPRFDVNRPIVFSLETNGPIEAITARQEGANVVKWMWRFAFAAWVICFLPIPGVSTFLVWLFAAVSGTLAFVALFKNRVGAGIGCSIALMLVTPAVWFFSLWLYAMLLGTAAIRAEEAAQARRSGAQNQAAVQNEDSRTSDLRRQEAQASELQRQAELERQAQERAAQQELARAEQAAAEEQARQRALEISSQDCTGQPAIVSTDDFGDFRDRLATYAVAANIDFAYIEPLFLAHQRPEPAMGSTPNNRTYWWESALMTRFGDVASGEVDSIRQVVHYRQRIRSLDVEVREVSSFYEESQLLKTWVNETLLPKYRDALGNAHGEAICALRHPQINDASVAEVYIRTFAGFPPPPPPETSDTGITESSVAGRWSDQDGICEYFSNYSLVCNLNSGAPPIERRWSLNGDLLEWHGGAKRYVYRVVELTPQQMILENVFPESARGTRWVETRVN